MEVRSGKHAQCFHGTTTITCCRIRLPSGSAHSVELHCQRISHRPQQSRSKRFVWKHQSSQWRPHIILSFGSDFIARLRRYNTISERAVSNHGNEKSMVQKLCKIQGCRMGANKCPVSPAEVVREEWNWPVEGARHSCARHARILAIILRIGSRTTIAWVMGKDR